MLGECRECSQLHCECWLNGPDWDGPDSDDGGEEMKTRAKQHRMTAEETEEKRQFEAAADLKTSSQLARELFGKDASHETVFVIYDLLAYADDPVTAKENLICSHALANEVFVDGATPQDVFDTYDRVMLPDDDDDDDYEEDED